MWQTNRTAEIYSAKIFARKACVCLTGIKGIPRDTPEYPAIPRDTTRYPAERICDTPRVNTSWKTENGGKAEETCMREATKETHGGNVSKCSIEGNNKHQGPHTRANKDNINSNRQSEKSYIDMRLMGPHKHLGFGSLGPCGQKKTWGSTTPGITFQAHGRAKPSMLR